MKIIKSLFAFATLFSLNSASGNSITFNEKWPQIKAFHQVILKTIQNDVLCLESIKSYSGELFEKSEHLSVENMPEEYRNPKMIQNLLSLKKHSEIIHDLVQKKADDLEIKSAGVILYDAFRQIIELCSIQK